MIGGSATEFLFRNPVSFNLRNTFSPVPGRENGNSAQEPGWNMILVQASIEAVYYNKRQV